MTTPMTGFLRAETSRERARGDGGAAAIEYALGVALFLVVSMGAVQFLGDSATDEFGDRADRAGAPDLLEGATDGGSTDGGDTTGGTDGPPPVVEEVFFAGFSGVRSTGGNPWTANLKVDVDDDNGESIAGVTVTGTWTYSQGANTVTVDASCNQTNGSGACQFQLSDIPPGVGSVTFTLTDISGGVPEVVYNGGPQTQVVNK